ncbi:MAG: flagellar biosynthetic protein FliR [Hyphomicrobiales bacterium]|nr:flagellar biosynthetic protein FliR [Hyphomicrobiales bacterium]
MFVTFATESVYVFLLIFTRMGAAMMFMPGVGEVYVSMRARLGIALAVAFMLMPLLRDTLPAVPMTVPGLALLLLGEATVGVFIGMLGRTLQATLHVAGMVIAFQNSLASALLFDPNQGSQGSVVGNFMTLLGLTMLFTSNLHHLMLTGVVDSYTLFTPGHMVPLDDFSEFFSQVMMQGFQVAFKIASPMMVVGLVVYLISGILARLMPTMQVFFVIIPAQLLLSFFIISLTLSAGMYLYLRFFEETFSTFLQW